MCFWGGALMAQAKIEGLRVSAAPLRMQAVVDGEITILEGEELNELVATFFKAARDPSREGDAQMRFLFAFAAAFKAVYGAEASGKGLDTPNARKMELFVHGIRELAAVM